MSNSDPFRSEEARAAFYAAYDEEAGNYPVPWTDEYIATSYGSTYVRISGPRDAPSLILLPGMGGSSLMWSWNVAAFAPQFRIFAVDTITEYGRSVPTQPIRRADDYVVWLDELLAGLECGKPSYMMGLSQGGMITVNYAVQRPDRLDGIVILAPAATVLPMSRTWVFRTLLCLVPIPLIAERYFHWLFSDMAAGDEDSQELLRKFMYSMNLAARSFKPRPMVPAKVLEDEQWSKLKPAALFLVGANEKIYSPQEAVERLGRVAPQIQAEIIHDAGHDLTFVQAELVNQRVLAFLSQS